MKKNYEKNKLLIGLIFVFMVVELIVVYTLFSSSYRKFKTIDGIIITKNYIKSYVDSTTLKKLKSSNYFYLDNKRLSYEIINIEKDVLKQNNKSYNEVMIKFEIPKKYKDNDTVKISIYCEKEKIYKIFIRSWEDDQ